MPLNISYLRKKLKNAISYSLIIGDHLPKKKIYIYISDHGVADLTSEEWEKNKIKLHKDQGTNHNTTTTKLHPYILI